MVETRRVRAGVREVAVDVYGRYGPWVLLLHGIPGWRGTFRGVAERLAPDHRVAVPDLLGFGDSDPAPRGAHADLQADMVIGLLDALGVPSAHLVGFDYGGPIALLTYSSAEARVSSLTLAATNVFADARIPLPLKIAKVPLAGDVAFRLAFSRPGLLALWRVATCDREAFPLSRYLGALRSSQGVTSTQRVFLESLRYMRPRYHQVEEALPLVDVPRTVVWGDRDPFFPVEAGERTADALAARFVLLEGCGHFVPEERPEELADEVRRLTRQVTLAELEETGPGPRPQPRV